MIPSPWVYSMEVGLLALYSTSVFVTLVFTHKVSTGFSQSLFQAHDIRDDIQTNPVLSNNRMIIDPLHGNFHGCNCLLFIVWNVICNFWVYSSSFMHTFNIGLQSIMYPHVCLVYIFTYLCQNKCIVKMSKFNIKQSVQCAIIHSLWIISMGIFKIYF